MIDSCHGLGHGSCGSRVTTLLHMVVPDVVLQKQLEDVKQHVQVVGLLTASVVSHSQGRVETPLTMCRV